MQPFLVINHHEPQECEAVGVEGAPPRLKGTKFYCPCPFGEHAFYMIVEGDTAEEIIQGLPPSMRRGTRAVAIEIMEL